MSALTLTLVAGTTPITVDVSKPIDISLHITPNEQVNAFFLPRATFVPYRNGSFVASIEEGGPVRCDIITFAPHGNGTHTECIGHVAGQRYRLPQCMTDLVDAAQLITVALTEINGDRVVTRQALEQAWSDSGCTTLVIRTTPNDDTKRLRQWSGTNPPYVQPEAMQLIVDRGVRHLMIDLPSVDREESAGQLPAHWAFWQWPAAPRETCTITEFIYVPDTVVDGTYGMMFNIAGFDGDAAPSRPQLLPIIQ
jgi:kynurenine formamidase